MNTVIRFPFRYEAALTSSKDNIFDKSQKTRWH